MATTTQKEQFEYFNLDNMIKEEVINNKEVIVYRETNTLLQTTENCMFDPIKVERTDNIHSEIIIKEEIEESSLQDLIFYGDVMLNKINGVGDKFIGEVKTDEMIDSELIKVEDDNSLHSELIIKDEQHECSSLEKCKMDADTQMILGEEPCSSYSRSSHRRRLSEDSDKNMTTSPYKVEDSCTSSEWFSSQSENESENDFRFSECAEITEGTNNEQRSDSGKQKNFCCFCKSEVLNFARHIYRNHATESEVKAVLSSPAASKKRKELLSLLRKKGNFLCNSEKGKPVKKYIGSTYLPCPDCLGFYASQHLWRHRKMCVKNETKCRITQSEAQNVMIKHLNINKELVSTVFPHMRADQISLVAKKDRLICAFGVRYIKIYRGKHFISVISRKMRELARILILIQNEQPEIISLLDSLKPQYYDLFVKTTKQVGQFDSSTGTYKSPTFALTIGTTLKQCCDIALSQNLKRKNDNIKTTEAEADIKLLKQIIRCRWRFDVSSQALNNAPIMQSKITLITLADDLRTLNKFLFKKAQLNSDGLHKHNNDKICYSKLLETVFCQVILLNKISPGELQKLLLSTYVNYDNQHFSEVLTKNEEFIMNTFDKVVIRRERGESFPVLFSSDVKDHIATLLLYRDNIYKQNNLYLFGNPNSLEPILVYKIIRKLVKASGVRHPDAITCSTLKKHLVRINQLFYMSETDMEQLVSFIGCTLGIFCSSFQHSDDIYQIVKIYKLLLLMEKGEGGQFKGKSWEDIEIDLDENLMTENEEYKGEEEESHSGKGLLQDLPESSQAPSKGNKLEQHLTGNVYKGKVIKRILVPWTDKQKNTVIHFFKKNIKEKRPPKKHECDKVKELHGDLLDNKDWLKIKVFVQNMYTNARFHQRQLNLIQ